MFSRFFALLPIAALVAVATAAPNALEARNGGGSNCSTGSEYCCNQALSGTTPFSGILGGLITAVVGANLNVGLTCTPITVIGVGSGAACSVQTACCTGTDQVGLVNLQCTPIAVNV